METQCPNCGHTFQEPIGTVTCRNDLLALWITCPECKEEYTEWFKAQRLGTTLDDCIATIPHRFFYPAEGQTEKSMVAAGVQKIGSVMKGG